MTGPLLWLACLLNAGEGLWVRYLLAVSSDPGLAKYGSHWQVGQELLEWQPL